MTQKHSYQHFPGTGWQKWHDPSFENPTLHFLWEHRLNINKSIPYLQELSTEALGQGEEVIVFLLPSLLSSLLTYAPSSLCPPQIHLCILPPALMDPRHVSVIYPY